MSKSGLDIRRRDIRPATPKQAATAIFSAPVAPARPIAAAPAVKNNSVYSTRTKRSHQVFSHLKILLIVFTTIVSTFVFSIATSQVLARITTGNPPVTGESARGAPNALANADIRGDAPASLAVTSSPDTLALSPVIITDPNAIYLPEEKIDAPDPLTERKAFLTTYLESKHSVLANHVDALSEQTQWKLIIAIADSESSYCKHNELNNCWGVGGAWNLKAYSNYDQAIADVNRLLEQKYVAAGLDSPDTIEPKWVGHANDNWEAAANQVMNDLKDVQ